MEEIGRLYRSEIYTHGRNSEGGAHALANKYLKEQFMLSEQQLNALNRHIEEIQSQLDAIAPIISSLQNKAKILNDVVRSIQSEPVEESQLKSSVSFVSNGNAPKS